MKKTIALILALVMCLSMLACAPKTFADAVEEMDKLVADWNSGHLNGFEYEAVYAEEENAVAIIMTTWYEDPDMYSSARGLKLSAENRYEEAAKCLRRLDSEILITIVTPAGEVLGTYTAADFE